MNHRRSIQAFLLFATIGAGACGRSVLDAADLAPQNGGSAGAASAGLTGTGGVMGVGDAPGVAGASGASGTAAAFCAAPAACNDAPAMSAIAGTCDVVPPPPGVPDAPASWYCDCAAGFSVNPKTRLCRPGTACQSAAADAWTVTVNLPTSDCAARTPEACGSPAALPDERLPGVVLLFLQRTCNLPSYHTVRIELVNGCVTRFQINTLGGAPIVPNLVSCLQATLPRFRWTCAMPMDCAMVEWDTSP